MSSIFRQDQLISKGGITRTKSLFMETSYEDPEYWLMTLKDHDIVSPQGQPLLSLTRLYVKYAITDPSEYTFAMEVFGSWAVWEKMCGSDARIQRQIAIARSEADVKRKSIVYRGVMDEVKEGSASFQAKKWISEEPWKAPETATDGRKKRKRQIVVAEAASEAAGLSGDLKRLKDEGYLQ